MIAFVFPGQGSQLIGMGRNIADEFSAAKDVFDEVDSTLGYSLSKLIWEGDLKELTLTVNAQPAIMATSLAVVAALRSEGITIDNALCMAGHSLGEYSALCAIGSITLSDTTRLLKMRGQYMQESVPLGKGSMAAILGLNLKAVGIVAKACSKYGVCEVANDNDPNQVVISGEKIAIEKACQHAKSLGARRAVILPVSAPFHSSLMLYAQQKMAILLAEINIIKPKVALISNVTATSITDPDQIRKNLVKQITGTVRWRESMMKMASLGVKRFVELGPGRVLSNLIKRTIKEAEKNSVGEVDEIYAVKEYLNV